MSDLTKLGWDSFFEQQLAPAEKANSPSAVIARIVEPARGMSRAVCRLGEVWAESADKSSDVPAVGDWVVGSLRSYGANEKRLTIQRILKRKNQLTRTAPGGKGYEQILCANIDTAFYVLALNQEVNPASVERYLSLLKESGAEVAIVVTKADTGSDSKPLENTLKQLACDTPIHLISVRDRLNLVPIQSYFEGSKTIVLMGSSGAGKSTLVNYLLGTEIQKVGDVRESDQKGRHTTTGRRLYPLPSGGMVIDSPGIRELQKWEGTSEVSHSFKPTKKAKSFKNSRSRRSQQED